MIDNTKCPFCGRQTGMYKSITTGYSIYGRGNMAIKQFFHNSCFDRYILNQKLRIIVNKESEENV